VRFWDTSAIVPLLRTEEHTGSLLHEYERDAAIIVWWATEVECASAISRAERERQLEAAESEQALARLAALKEEWDEIEPGDRIRPIALRLLRTHPLRAGDALQLSAAILASGGSPRSLQFVSLDERLVYAARREGFRVIDA
jgi:predicted nucleic acid-binding protein